MNGYDGPTLRAVRESARIPLRRISRQAGMSVGHLSKVERGEDGRPVTPAVVTAYEKVTGVRLGEAAAALARQGEGLRGAPRRTTWTPGQLTDARRRGFNASIAALALGGPLGEPLTRLLDATGRPTIPTAPDLGDVEQLEQMSHLFTTLDLQHGGGMTSQVIKHLLRWAVGMLDATITPPVPVGQRLHAAVGAITARAAWAAFDVDAHEAARSLHRLALYAAARASDPNLRAHILAEVAAQHNHLGYHDDALEVVRFGEGDERIDPPVQAVLHGVKARTYGALGQAEQCHQQIDAAQQQHRATQADRDWSHHWVATLATPGKVAAATGHALAALSRHTDDTNARQEAIRHLGNACEHLDPRSQARAVVLCRAELARLHLAGGELELGATHARTTLDGLTNIHSSRLVQALTTIHNLVVDIDQPDIKELAADIEAAITPEGDVQ